ALNTMERSAIQTIAQQTGMSADDVARVDPRNWAQRTWDSAAATVNKLSPANIAKAVGDAIFSVLLRFFSIITYLTALVYAKALPFFLGILNQMYVGVFPLIVAMAMLPGRWTAIVTWFEGYLWLAFMPVVIAAVDGFSMKQIMDTVIHSDDL